MKFCTDHWQKLRDEVARQGMESLVPTSGAEAMAKLASDLEAGASRVSFDPLMGAHNAIVANAMRYVGLELLLPNEDGTDRCPFCFLQVKHVEACKEPACEWTYEKSWIPGSVNEQREHAIRLGLIAEG